MNILNYITTRVFSKVHPFLHIFIYVLVTVRKIKMDVVWSTQENLEN